MDPIGGILLIGAVCTPLVLIGLLPTIIGFSRHHPNRWLIMAVNCFGGPFFGLGWVFAIIWALDAFHMAGASDSDIVKDSIRLSVNDYGRIRWSYRPHIRGRGRNVAKR